MSPSVVVTRVAVPPVAGTRQRRTGPALFSTAPNRIHWPSGDQVAGQVNPATLAMVGVDSNAVT